MCVTVAAAATKFIGYSGMWSLLRRLLYSSLHYRLHPLLSLSLFLCLSLNTTSLSLCLSFLVVTMNQQAVIAPYTINCTLYATDDIVRPFVDNSTSFKRCLCVHFTFLFFSSIHRFSNICEKESNRLIIIITITTGQCEATAWFILNNNRKRKKKPSLLNRHAMRCGAYLNCVDEKKNALRLSMVDTKKTRPRERKGEWQSKETEMCFSLQQQQHRMLTLIEPNEVVRLQQFSFCNQGKQDTRSWNRCIENMHGIRIRDALNGEIDAYHSIWFRWCQSGAEFGIYSRRRDDRIRMHSTWEKHHIKRTPNRECCCVCHNSPIFHSARCIANRRVQQYRRQLFSETATAPHINCIDINVSRTAKRPQN